MAMTEQAKLKVKVGDLLPGTHYRPTPGYKGYFPEIGWDTYADLFDSIRTNDARGYLEMWRLWEGMAKKRFGHIPTGDELPDHGKAWTWEKQEHRLRTMLASFEKHGYQPSLATGGEAEIKVAIQANGTMPVFQGNKRVALLRIFHGPEFELTVTVKERAEEWQRMRRAIYNIAGGKMDCYQPIEHPDFEGWTVTQPCDERMAMMRAELEYHWPNTVLDLGSHTGWFCRAFADTGGLMATGVEESPQAHRMSYIMAERQGLQGRIELQNSTILDYMSDPGRDLCEYDVCLFLSIVMHVFRDCGVNGGWDHLAYISRHCERMFLDLSWGAYAKHLPFTPDNIGPMICEKTEFTSWQLLGRTNKENRPFYVFRR